MLLDGTEPEVKRPKVLGARSLILALVIHLALFIFAYLFAIATRKPHETVIPIDLTVVIQENLDGNEDEPPPLKPPTPEPPPPPPPPKPQPPKPAPPKPIDDPKVDAVVKTPTNVVKKVEKPKKSAAEIKKEKEKARKERLEKMREKGKVVKGDKKPAERQPNGKTGKKTLSDAEIQRLLNQGYKPGRTEQLASSEQQRCISLIRAAFYEKWDRPPWTDTLREMHLSIQLGSGGRILGYKLIQSSGDSRADATVLQAASLVRSVRGLSNEFISQNKTITVNFKVTPH